MIRPFALLAMLSVSFVTSAGECPGTPRTVTGTVYCDNKFVLWINGREIASDPVAFTPHQAVRVEFPWDGKSDITYAISCEDYASVSGYEYVETAFPQLGDGALIARFDDGMSTTTNAADWRVYTVTFGPTDKSRQAGCRADNLAPCIVENRGTPRGWTLPDFDDREWLQATRFSAGEAGWGRPPTWSPLRGCCTLTSPADGARLGCDQQVGEDACLAPRPQFEDSAAEFIWAADLERDNRVLFRHTASCSTRPKSTTR